MNRSKELTVGYKKTSVLAKEIRGKKTFHRIVAFKNTSNTRRHLLCQYFGIKFKPMYYSGHDGHIV